MAAMRLWILLLCSLWSACQAQYLAQPLVEVCPAVDGPPPQHFDAADCSRSSLHAVDPQGRMLWLRAQVVVPAQAEAALSAPLGLYLSIKGSSEAFLNGQRLGSNGQPALDAGSERPGRMDVALPIPAGLLREGSNDVLLRMSSHQGWLQLRTPIHLIGISALANPQDQYLRHYLPTLLPLGIFVLAGCYFISSLRHSEQRGRILWLIGMTALATLQLLLEISRGLVPYAYPVQDLRLIGITTCCVLFALCLAGMCIRRHAQPRWQWPLLLSCTAALLLIAAWVPGMDHKSVYALLLGSLVGMAACIHGARRQQPQARTMAWALACFTAVNLLAPAIFLDLSFFYVVAAFLVFLMHQQARALASERALQQQQRARADQLQRVLDERREAHSECVLSVVSTGRLRPVPARQIVHVRGAGDYMELHLEDGSQHLHSVTLTELETQLPSSFLRVHRSFIVNTRHIDRLQRHDGGTGTLILHNGVEIPVSRRVMPTVRKALR